MARTRAALAVALAVTAALILVSGGSRADPRTPPALPGLPAPFLGTAVVGHGGRTAAIDAYGDVIDLRAPGPAGRGLVAVPAARQEAGSVSPEMGLVARMGVGRRSIPLWRADSVEQRYLPETNVLRTEARIRTSDVEISYAVGGRSLMCRSRPKGRLKLGRSHCEGTARQIQTVADADRRWVARARPLGAAAPGWARQMYVRSLLVLRALTDRRTGAAVAGARDGWAYVWPRDAGAVAMALASAGYRPEARRIARFLLGLDLGAAARFRGTGMPVGGRAAEGDAAGWVAAAARAAGLPTVGPSDSTNRQETAAKRPQFGAMGAWRDRADYQEGETGDYLANAIATAAVAPADGPISRLYLQKSSRQPESVVAGPTPGPYLRKSPRRREGAWIAAAFGTRRGLVRQAGDAGSGLDSAAAWAVRPFPLPALFPLVRRTLHRLVARAGAFGITPGEGLTGNDPWTAPTAWSAWSLAALSDSERRAGSRRAARGDRRAAIRLMGDLRRAATPLGLLPERVGARSGLPRSTTPLAWSHAFAILALRELWPGRAAGSR